MHFKSDGLAGQRVIEVEAHGALADFDHGAGIAAQAVGGGELHDLTHCITLVRIAHLGQQLVGDPLLHVGIALAKGLAGRYRERRPLALGEPQQALFDRRRQLASTQRQRGRLVVEGVDDIASGTGQPVVQREKGAGLDHGGSRRQRQDGVSR